MNADTFSAAFGSQVARTMLARCVCGEDELNLVEATDMVTLRHRGFADLGEALAARGLGAEWAAREAELTALACRSLLATLKESV